MIYIIQKLHIFSSKVYFLPYICELILYSKYPDPDVDDMGQNCAFIHANSPDPKKDIYVLYCMLCRKC